jgi:transposase InsO family protein
MTIYGSIVPKSISISNWAYKVQSLTSKGKHRLKIIDWHRAHGENISLTARHFGLTRYTVRQWVKRFNRQGILGLNNRSRRPKHLRQPTTSRSIVFEIRRIRKQYPAWSKYKIKVLLNKQGIDISASTIGRILKRKGLIDRKISQKRRRAAKHPKTRFPRGLKVSQPGDLIQIDTKHIMLVGGRRFYQFTAIDILTKTRVLDIYSSESSRNGADFLNQCLKVFPFFVRAAQTDNGAPFQKEFEELCKKKNLPHYFIYPRSPKQNSYVEISQRADKYEFYQQGNVCSSLKVMKKRIKEWQDIWNNTRPHQALNYLTPQEYLEKWKKGQLPTKDVITLQT